ncbi:hypothetical protein BDN70DRAFT_866830 [Pholiota conissans]|uniref:Uncharacterized protein n=1 Tax=Pholiota conissans TaxID=109636 RepID=A0A9P5YSW7_9AGAR|nr:hypothetical protein BDN70DRAFT_866830 [Pholiota conissans]
MPGPGNRNKGKGKTKVKQGAKGKDPTESSTVQGSSQPQSEAVAPETVLCMTLDEDEITRCGNPATNGHPRPERCKLHHKQYKKMYGKYKDASKIVDEVEKEGKIPTKIQIEDYTDVAVILDQRRYLKRYIEAIRVERTGREIHGRRFFLKVDDGHKMRLKILTRGMIRGVEALDNLETRAYKLHFEKNPLPDWAEAAVLPPARNGKISVRDQLLSPEITVAASTRLSIEGSANNNVKAIAGSKLSRSPAMEDEDADLIDLELIRCKADMMHAFELFLDSDAVASGIAELTEKDVKDEEVHRNSIFLLHIMRQYALRIIFYEPALYLKAQGKVSLKDFILSDDFSMEDIARFNALLTRKLDIGLLWMKDSVVEAVNMLSAGGLSANAANIGHPNNRIKILDGWIYNVPHIKKVSNEAWFRLIDAVGPVPPNIENRFVRLCNNFDDLISVLSFGALGSMPPPSFCKEALVYRNHLSLSGVAITDMVSTSKPAELNGVVPTLLPSRRGYRTWAQAEFRAYMFGAIRNEPDAFTDAFLNELKSRPDLFQVILHSESDPAGEIQVYGPVSPLEEPIPQVRGRNFEAPLGETLPEGRGPWSFVLRTAKDILYGTDPKLLLGYLTELSHGASAGWFFHFKKFKVKYIVIMDMLPNRHHRFLAQGVAWAALRAQGYAKGEYTERKYAAASNDLFDKCAKERLGWLPAGSWSTTSM